MSNYTVIDDVLSEENFQRINNVVRSSEFPWYYSNGVAYEDGYNVDQYYFAHVFYNDHAWNSTYKFLIEPILDFIQPKALIKIKANFFPRSDKLIENLMHVDHEFPHRGAVYYVNSNDGFTILEDGTKIESIANRLLLFDSSLPHKSTHCTNDHGRINFNMSFF